MDKQPNDMSWMQVEIQIKCETNSFINRWYVNSFVPKLIQAHHNGYVDGISEKKKNYDLEGPCKIFREAYNKSYGQAKKELRKKKA